MTPAAESVLGRVAGGLARFWQGLITAPVRNGRLRDTGWPVGLRPVVVVGIIAFCLAVALILMAPAIRAASPLSVTVGSTVLALPRLVLPTIFWLVILSIALVQTAALHVRARTAFVLTLMSALVLLFLGALDLGADGEGGVAVTPGKIVSVLAVAALVALLLARRRRGFAWWEFPVVLTIIAATAVVALGRSAQQSAAFGLDFGPPTASLVMSSIGQLAVPAPWPPGSRSRSSRSRRPRRRSPHCSGRSRRCGPPRGPTRCPALSRWCCSSLSCSSPGGEWPSSSSGCCSTPGRSLIRAIFRSRRRSSHSSRACGCSWRVCAATATVRATRDHPLTPPLPVAARPASRRS